MRQCLESVKHGFDTQNHSHHTGDLAYCVVFHMVILLFLFCTVLVNKSWNVLY